MREHPAAEATVRAGGLRGVPAANSFARGGGRAPGRLYTESYPLPDRAETRRNERTGAGSPDGNRRPPYIYRTRGSRPGEPEHGLTAASGAAGPDHVLRSRTLGAVHDVELHDLALGERLEALGLDGREVDEQVPATLALNETEAL